LPISVEDPCKIWQEQQPTWFCNVGPQCWRTCSPLLLILQF
jgi:hypothetical protein